MKIISVVVLAALVVKGMAFAQGPLTPPGAPSPTMKTLQQIEPRTPITNAPVTIAEPGSYYLTTNITAAGTALLISVSGVTVDLNGFNISSAAPSPTGSAILLSGGPKNIQIRNGSISGGVTNGGGVYAGSGFVSGISYQAGAPSSIHVSNISVSGCLGDGIQLVGSDNSTVVESCIVRTVGGYGIVADRVADSSASQCGLAAITANTVSHSRGDCTGSDVGVNGRTVDGCYGTSVFGAGLLAYTANNCYGLSTNSTGLAAQIANNCQGINTSGGGPGLAASYSAVNCFGQNNSILYSAVSCDNIAIGSLGINNSGLYYGLTAYIANSCHGSPSVSATFKYNMP